MTCAVNRVGEAVTGDCETVFNLRGINRLDFVGISSNVTVGRHVEGVAGVAGKESYRRARSVDFQLFVGVSVIAVIIAVADFLADAVQNGDFAGADREDNIVAAGRNFCNAAADLDCVFALCIVSDNVVAVARRINERVGTFAARQGIVAGAAQNCIVAASGINRVVATSAVNVVSLISADNFFAYAVFVDKPHNFFPLDIQSK